LKSFQVTCDPHKFFFNYHCHPLSIPFWCLPQMATYWWWFWVNFLWLGLGQPFIVWVWIWKISPKNVKFSIFFPSDQKNLFGKVQKVPGSKASQFLIYCGSGQGPSLLHTLICHLSGSGRVGSAIFGLGLPLRNFPLKSQIFQFFAFRLK